MSCAEGSLAAAAVPAFAAAWPRVAAALPLPAPRAPELRGAAARCCTLALRAHARAPALRAALPDLAHAAAAALPAPGGHGFAGPLSVALSLFGEDASLGPALAGALDVVARAPEVRALAVWAAGDQCPELAQARSLPPARFS